MGNDAGKPKEQVEPWPISYVLGWNRYTLISAHCPLTIKHKWLSPRVGRGSTLTPVEGPQSHMTKGIDTGHHAEWGPWFNLLQNSNKIVPSAVTEAYFLLFSKSCLYFWDNNNNNLYHMRLFWH